MSLIFKLLMIVLVLASVAHSKDMGYIKNNLIIIYLFNILMFFNSTKSNHNYIPSCSEIFEYNIDLLQLIFFPFLLKPRLWSNVHNWIWKVTVAFWRYKGIEMKRKYTKWNRRSTRTNNFLFYKCHFINCIFFFSKLLIDRLVIFRLNNYFRSTATGFVRIFNLKWNLKHDDRFLILN